ncbi:hypothetical protein V491_01405 [Pseudogymnoascus sp. VKM F-3775]|nr:hypothetical protein V491_01405 [Pseudogymnoascus sp. VKM F-3775]
MTKLLGLPVELVTAILGFLRLQGIASLASTNKQLHSISNPVLFQQGANGKHPRALRWGAEYGQMVTFQTVVEAIGDVYQKEGTALHCTAYCYTKTVDELLIEMEVPIIWIGDGQTALMRAVSDGEPSTVELLLQQGANVTQQAVTIQHG